MVKVDIQFSTSGASFQEYGDYQLEEVIEQISKALRTYTCRKIIDMNGNCIGKIDIKD